MSLTFNNYRVYVAGPYTNPDPVTNTRAAVAEADKLLALGYSPFIPHLTLLQHAISPRPYEDWLAIDLEWVKVCDLLYRMPGASSGADKEVAFAEDRGMTVCYSIDEIVAKTTEWDKNFAAMEDGTYDWAAASARINEHVVERQARTA